MTAQTPVPWCSRHPGSGFVYVCKSCEDQLICMECVTDSHNGHTLGKLTDYLADQKREIQQYVDKLSETEIPKIEGGIYENETNSRDRKIINDIKCQGKQMKDNIDNAIDLLVKMCTELEKNDTGVSENSREDVYPKLDKCKQVLASGTTVDVTSLAREIANTSIDSPSFGRLQTVEFKPGTVSVEFLEHMLGKILVDGEDPSYKPIPKPVFLSEFKTSFPFSVFRPCLTGDETWLSHWEEKNIYRVDSKGNVKEKIECKDIVGSMSVSPTTGRVWFCVRDDRSIREITTGGDVVTRFTVHNTPGSLCITSDDMVVVGMKGEMQLYTTDGRAVSAGADGPCRQVASWPHHIVSCSETGDVAAVDSDGVVYTDYLAGRKPDNQPQVIVMDKDLNLKFRCKDNETSKSKFLPCDVCFNGAGDVLVTELSTKSILLINRNTGRCMRTVYTSPAVTPWIISYSLHEDGAIWIGHVGCYLAILGDYHLLAEIGKK